MSEQLSINDQVSREAQSEVHRAPEETEAEEAKENFVRYLQVALEIALDMERDASRRD